MQLKKFLKYPQMISLGFVPAIASSILMTSPDFDMRLDRSWLNPVNVLELQKAVKKRKSDIKLNERWFSIRYHDELGKLFIKAKDDYAPCAWLSYEELERFKFEDDHDKHL